MLDLGGTTENVTGILSSIEDGAWRGRTFKWVLFLAERRHVKTICDRPELYDTLARCKDMEVRVELLVRNDWKFARVIEIKEAVKP